MSNTNVLIIGDCHIPFEHKDYLDFCTATKKKFNCSLIVHIGDLVDNHAISYHEHSPNGLSSKQEVELSHKKLKKWYKSFPKVSICKGNHDLLPTRKAVTHGLAEDYVRTFEEMWDLPKKWKYDWSFQIQGVKYVHGTGYSGKTPHITAAVGNRQSTVIGHCHTVAGVDYMASDRDIIFGLSVGCGIDRKAYAFNYAKYWKNKPILGCGVVTNNGNYAQFVPMSMK